MYFPFTPTNDPKEKLHDMPHYTDEHFREAQTIYGEKESGLSYTYSDRIEQWDYNKARKAAKVADQSGAERRTAEWYQIYLTNYFERQITIKHILAGWNLSNGFPYQVIGYKEAQQALKVRR